MTGNNASAFVRFKGVEKSYDGLKTVVKRLDLDVAQGEFLTLLGPSGSGKTTSLMMLAGFETPTHGHIFLEGNAIESVPAHRRGIGLTVVFVTHDQAEALTLSDRIAIFNDGVIQQVDTPQTLYERPANSFVATFMGDTNVLPGVLGAFSSDLCQVQLDQGEQLTARTPPGLATGCRTSLSIRSERVTLDGDDSYDSRLAGCIEECIYLGDHVRIRLNVAGNHDFNVKVPIAQMQSRWREGHRVPVCWHSADASALDAMPA